MKRFFFIILISILSLPSIMLADSGCIIFNNILRMQSEDSTTDGEVSKLQKFLIDNGNYTGEVSGYYGKNTAKAVLDFQKKNGISTDSKNPWLDAVVGHKTKEKIFYLTCELSAITSPSPSPVVQSEEKPLTLLNIFSRTMETVANKIIDAISPLPPSKLAPSPTPYVSSLPVPRLVPTKSPIASPMTTQSPSPTISSTPTPSISSSPSSSPTPSVTVAPKVTASPTPTVSASP
ncbi:MAG: peptidoglycan-binding domain-containing protein, partial [bacterium]|nr:peptidoglycan-binding domain-containing protein [bacterium]